MPICLPWTFATVLIFAATVRAGAIHDAVDRANLPEVRRLVAANPNLATADDGGGREPIHYAAVKGHRAIVQFLLEKGADIDAKQRDPYYPGATPLYGASQKGHRELALFLLARGADTNAAVTGGSYAGVTALHEAAARMDKQLAEELIKRGADVNAGFEDGKKPLHCVIDIERSGPSEAQRRPLVELLLANGAVVDAKYRGYTPLHAAAYLDYPVLCKVLLDARAEVNATNKAGQTPFALASQKGYKRVMDVLKKRGGTE